jgi:hypothetical protein
MILYSTLLKGQYDVRSTVGVQTECYLLSVSDYPRKSTYDGDSAESRNVDTNGSIKNDQSNDAGREQAQPSHISKGSTSNAGGPDIVGSFSVLFLGATVGVATVMAALLVAIVACFVTSSKRKRKSAQHQPKHQRRPPEGSDQRGPMAPSAVPLHTDFGFPSAVMMNGNYDDVSHPSHCGGNSSATAGVSAAMPNDARYGTLQRQQSAAASVPGVCSRKNSKTSCTVTASPKPATACYHQSDPPPSYPGSATLPRRTVAQPKTMGGTGDKFDESLPYGSLLHHHMPTTASDNDRPLSMSELPPPPDFLLEAVSATPPPDAGIGGYSGSTGRRRPLKGTPMMFEIADGYRSGDSVDDDIDDIDPTIRTPSMFVQPY